MTWEDPTLAFFSGLGADDRLFREQKKRFPGLSVIPWIEPRRRETLAGYASRMAEKAASLRPAYLGGSSFGGMLALEVAKILHPDGVLLFGSCRSAGSIRRIHRVAASISSHLPISFLRLGEVLAPLVARAMGASDPEIRHLLGQMHRSVGSGFIRWGLGAIAGWPGVEDPGVLAHHIHGGSDRLIPVARVRPDRVIPGAGHVLTLTHPEEVNRFIADATKAGS